MPETGEQLKIQLLAIVASPVNVKASIFEDCQETIFVHCLKKSQTIAGAHCATLLNFV